MLKKIETKNGLRVMSVTSKSSKTVTILALVGVGSKYEKKEINGISHFLEHMYFKGTEKRPTPKEVSEHLDKIGGYYNAFTGDEYTGYYAKVATTHFDKALDWVSDIFLNSKIPAKEIEKEKGVIIEEINMVKDHPMHYINTLWTSLLYGDQPAGRDIAGTKETVSSITRKDLLSYMKSGYVAPSTVICVSGNIDDKKIKKVIKAFSSVPKKKPLEKDLVVEKQKKPSFLIEKRKTDQTHISVGFRACDLFDNRRHTFQLIETILGKMMSSRMFSKIREEMGLAYYIKTDYDHSTDSGFLVTQAGVDNKKSLKAVSAILNEYKEISRKKVPLNELNKAKENIRGRMAISLESSDAEAYFYGLQELLTKKTKTTKEILKEIDKVTVDDILETSREFFIPENLNLVAIGMVDKNNIKKIINKF
jgi:predicted Zn-dependent peptidase